MTMASPALVLAPLPAFLTTVAKAPPNSAFFQPGGIGVCIVPPPGMGVFNTLPLALGLPTGSAWFCPALVEFVHLTDAQTD